MSYLRRQILPMLIDAVLVALSLWLAFMLRFDGVLNPVYLHRFLIALPYFVLCSIPLFLIFGLYRSIWKYASLRDYASIFAAVTMATLPLLLGRFLLIIIIPYGVLGINWFISLMLIGGVRAATRLPAELSRRQKNDSPASILIVGAGNAGVMILRELRSARLGRSLRPVGFVDDDPTKQGRTIDGLKVLGSREAIPRIVEKHKIDEIVIAMPSASRNAIRELLAICRETDASVKILPGIYQLINDQVSVMALRDVAIEDLLGRPPVAVDLEEMAVYLRGQTILVTGAGGSIGSELCRQIARFNPSELLLLGRGEHSIYQIYLELKTRFPELKATPIIADIRDRDRLDRVFADFRPTIIFHAAAHKHVPLMEEAPDEAIKNNVFGTQNVAELADKYGIKSFVLISSDKAVRPTSVMGATKRAAELIIQDLAKRSSTRYCAVRFGNVLGSRGSVIPLFQQQIAKGGPVTVTDPRMVRFFMTIPEAVNLVIQAGAMGKGGEIYVLDMGEPVRIMDLARDLIRLSGYEPEKEIEIVITGPRPGEKLYEEVLTAEEGVTATRHERIYVAKLSEDGGKDLRQGLRDLQEALSEPAACVQELTALIPCYSADTRWHK
ncbi:MAG: polysaccharide biosynthesis protein [Bacteroidota bacterium]